MILYIHLILGFSESQPMSNVTLKLVQCKKKTLNVKNKERRHQIKMLMRNGILNHKVLSDLYKDEIK